MRPHLDRPRPSALRTVPLPCIRPPYSRGHRFQPQLTGALPLHRMGHLDLSFFGPIRILRCVSCAFVSDRGDESVKLYGGLLSDSSIFCGSGAWPCYAVGYLQYDSCMSPIEADLPSQLHSRVMQLFCPCIEYKHRSLSPVQDEIRTNGDPVFRD